MGHILFPCFEQSSLMEFKEDMTELRYPGLSHFPAPAHRIVPEIEPRPAIDIFEIRDKIREGNEALAKDILNQFATQETNDKPWEIGQAISRKNEIMAISAKIIMDALK